MLRPEPGPVGASVDPLGEAPGARLFPDGFILALPFGEVGPVVEGDPVPTPTVPADAPVAVLPAAPELEPPAEPPVPCANARVVDSAKAPARAIVVSFMIVFLWILVREQLPTEP